MIAPRQVPPSPGLFHFLLFLSLCFPRGGNGGGRGTQRLFEHRHSVYIYQNFFAFDRAIAIKCVHVTAALCALFSVVRVVYLRACLWRKPRWTLTSLKTEMKGHGQKTWHLIIFKRKHTVWLSSLSSCQSQTHQLIWVSLTLLVSVRTPGAKPQSFRSPNRERIWRRSWGVMKARSSLTDLQVVPKHPQGPVPPRASLFEVLCRGFRPMKTRTIRLKQFLLTGSRRSEWNAVLTVLPVFFYDLCSLASSPPRPLTGFVSNRLQTGCSSYQIQTFLSADLSGPEWTLDCFDGWTLRRRAGHLSWINTPCVIAPKTSDLWERRASFLDSTSNRNDRNKPSHGPMFTHSFVHPFIHSQWNQGEFVWLSRSVLIKTAEVLLQDIKKLQACLIQTFNTKIQPSTTWRQGRSNEWARWGPGPPTFQQAYPKLP